jgi:hypothetical protein
MTPSTGNDPGRIFMSYRREDTAFPAGWLYDRLASHFGRDQVFKDVDSIELGDDFIDVITTAVESCDVLLAVIGDRWLAITDSDGQRRLDNPHDFVRLEIEAALIRNVRVIPILVEGARMPRAHELPESLAKLTRRQTLELSPNRFDIDTQRLLRVLDRAIAEAQEHARHEAEAAARRRQVGQLQEQIRERAAAQDWDAVVAASGELAALDPAAAARQRRQAGHLGVEHVGGELAFGEWDVLRILVRNKTGIPLGDVTIAVSGPFRTDGKRARIAVLGDGAAARFPFNVNAVEGGRHVPVSVHTTYSYPDGLGSVRSQTQDDRLDIVVAKPEAPNTQPGTANDGVGEQTMLYLAASPRDMEPLRSDLEMRKVKERLQLSRHRDRYRVEFCVAPRLVDISQALMDYAPQVVHVSGYGDEDGNLRLEDEKGSSQPVTPEGLAALFGLHKATIQCVIVNACYSLRLARAMARHIDYVVGMRSQIGDEAAIQFSVGFYLGLFAGQSVPDAFNRGCAHIQADQATESEHLTPVLLGGPGPEASGHQQMAGLR